MQYDTLDGVKMLRHDEMKNYERIQRQITKVLQVHGCKIIETPSFEDYDVYQQFFPDLRREMVKTIDTDGRVLVLRPDVTLPLVETAAREFPEKNRLLKFGYVSTVFREYCGKTAYGKEFLQGGAEIFGDGSAECDGEVVVMAAEILMALGVDDIRIDMGTAAYTQALFSGLQIAEKEKKKLRRLLNERNLVAFAAYADTLPLSETERQALNAMPVLFGSYEETLAKARSYCLNPAMQAALDRLEAVYAYVDAAGYRDKVYLDFGFTSPLGYYTDMIFKIYVAGASYDVIDGGRYDDVSACFGTPRPACGFGMNINLLYEFMDDAGLLAGTEPTLQLLIRYDRSDRRLASQLASWRRRGYRVAACGTGCLVDKRDYSLAAEYTKGNYYRQGQVLSPEELEELIRGLCDGASYCLG